MWLGQGWTVDVTGGRDVPWLWLGVGVERWTLDVARGRGRGMHYGVAGGRGVPWM